MQTEYRGLCFYANPIWNVINKRWIEEPHDYTANAAIQRNIEDPPGAVPITLEDEDGRVVEYKSKGQAARELGYSSSTGLEKRIRVAKGGYFKAFGKVYRIVEEE